MTYLTPCRSSLASGLGNAASCANVEHVDVAFLFPCVIDVVQAPQELVEEASRLQRLLQQHLSIMFDMQEMGEVSDEDAPVVVEL